MKRAATHFVLAALLSITACSGKYRVDRDEDIAESSWPYHRGQLSSTGAVEHSEFDGKLDVVWEYESNDKPAGPLTIHDKQLVYPGARNKIRFVSLVDGSGTGYIKPKGNVQTGVVTTDTLGFFALSPRKNRLKCINLTNGKKLWDKPVSDVSAGLLLYDNKLIVGTGGGALMALSPEDGDLVWGYQSDSKLSIPATIADDTMYLPGDNGMVYALDPHNGEEIYRVQLDGSLASPVAVGELIFVTDVEGRVHALDKSDGHIVWQQELTGPIWTSPAVSGGRLFVGHSGGELVALDAFAGEILWTYRAVDVISSSALAIGDYVIFGTQTGKLYSLSATDGALVDQRKLKGPITVAPISNGSHVFVADDKGVITCFGEAPPIEEASL